MKKRRSPHPTGQRESSGSGVDAPPIPLHPLSAALADNRAALKSALGENLDLAWRELKAGTDGPDALLVCFRSLVDPALIGDAVIKPLAESTAGEVIPRTLDELLYALRVRYLASAEVTEVSDSAHPAPSAGQGRLRPPA
ncbi:MAG: hypothetical protein Q8P31_06330 [Bacillota bacterium]|nr:hypothetical protein [Bacillota bacterium]